jgi:hypothetical protein
MASYARQRLKLLRGSPERRKSAQKSPGEARSILGPSLFCVFSAVCVNVSETRYENAFPPKTSPWTAR